MARFQMRYLGKPPGPALTSVAPFKDASRLRGPGVFAYADCAGLTAAFDKLQKGRPLTDYEWSAVKAFFNPSAIHQAAASLTLNSSMSAL